MNKKNHSIGFIGILSLVLLVCMLMTSCGNVGMDDTDSNIDIPSDSNSDSDTDADIDTSDSDSSTDIDKDTDTERDTASDSDKDSDVTTDSTNDSAESKGYVWVICSSLNIRDAQVLSLGNKIGTAFSGDRFEVLEKADTYTKIMYNGREAYISANPEYVSFTEPQQTPEPPAKTYVWVICDSLNIRDNSVLASGNRLGVASKGDKFEVIERAETYTKVVYNGGEAYISAKPEYVSFTEPEQSAVPAKKVYVWVVCPSLNIRDNSVLASGNVIGTASKGDKFEVLERSDTYTKIVYNDGEAYISAKSEYVSFYNMEVIRKIIYAVETGGQVYGRADYADFTEAYANSSAEHAITIGAGQWYATEAKTLLNLIRSTDPTLFASLDTEGIAKDLDTADWSTYKLSKTSAKAKCIQAIIDTDVGHACQDQLLDAQMLEYMELARTLGVTDVDALMMCANIRHQGGTGALKRVLGKTATPYTLDNIYEALKTDTGNQVGAYKSRQKMVYESLKKYL